MTERQEEIIENLGNHYSNFLDNNEYEISPRECFKGAWYITKDFLEVSDEEEAELQEEIDNVFDNQKVWN